MSAFATRKTAAGNGSLATLALPLLVLLLTTLAYRNAPLLAAHAEAIFGPGAARTLPAAAATVLWLSGAWLLSRLIDVALIDPLLRGRSGADAPRIVSNCVSASLFIATLFVIIKVVYGKPVGGLLATSGLVTLVIGFALRDMIADFFSGIALNLDHPYRIGDWLELGPGLIGRVTGMNWRATRLVTQARKTVVVPNSELAERQFLNLSLPERHYRESLDIVLNYTADPARIENILLAAVLATEGLAGERHDVRIARFDERGVVYQIRFWVPDFSDTVRLRHRIAVNVLHYLHQAGVPIPYEQHEVVLTRARRPRKERRINARRLLSRIDWLESLTEEELERLADVAEGRQFDADREIVRQGEEGVCLYVLVEGVAEVVSRDQDGSVARVGQIQPGQAFGEMALLTGAPRAATVRSLTEVYVLRIRRADVEAILRARPAIAEQLGRVMARRQMLNERRQLDEAGGEPEDLKSRAMQLAKRISVFFGV